MRFSASTIILALTLGAVTASPVPAGLETRGRDDVCRANPGLADAIRDVEPVFKASFVEGGHGQKRDVEVEAPQDEEDDLDKRDMNTCLNCFLNKLNPLLATRLVVRNQYGAAAYSAAAHCVIVGDCLPGAVNTMVQDFLSRYCA